MNDINLFENGIDLEYVQKMKDFFNSLPIGEIKDYVVRDLTDNPVKFVTNVKFYITNKEFIKDYRDVTFNDDLTKIRIEESLPF